MSLFNFNFRIVLDIPDWAKRAIAEIAVALNRSADNSANMGKLLEALLRASSPRKATNSKLFATGLESPDPDIPPEVQIMQGHAGKEGLFATIRFNGSIDEAPAVALTPGSPGVLSGQDDPVVTPDPSDATGAKVFTDVKFHFRNDGAQGTGHFGLTGKVKADDLATEAEEDVLIDYPDLGEWIPPDQLKATSSSILASGTEPI